MGSPKTGFDDDKPVVREYSDGVKLKKTTWQIIQFFRRNYITYVKYLDGDEICRISPVYEVPKLEETIQRLKTDATYRYYLQSKRRETLEWEIIQFFSRNDISYVEYLDGDKIRCTSRVYKIPELEKDIKRFETDSKYCYFCKNYRYSDSYFPNTEIFVPINRTRNKMVDTMIFRKLQEGDNVRKLHEIVKTYCYGGPLEGNFTEFDRLFQRFEKPYIDEIYGEFSYAKIIVNCASTVTVEDVKKYKSKLHQKVLKELEESKEFKKYEIPITILQISNLVLTRDKRLEYTIDVKNELRNL